MSIPFKRRPNGQFAPGGPGGPGRPPRAVEADYLRSLSDACPLERWRRICERAAELAEEGDPQARAWLAKYLCGNGSATLSDSLTFREDQARWDASMLGD